MSRRHSAHDGTGVLETVGSYGITRAWGTTVPADATAGYAPGCTFIHIDGSSGSVLYVNDGSSTSCEFNAVATPGNNYLVEDDDLFRLGTDGDQVLVNRSTALATNTALTSVIVGTPVTPAVAANSLIISGITANGDVMIATNNGGNSQAGFLMDASAGETILYGAGTEALVVTATAVRAAVNAVPDASDGAALGTTALMWADLFLASGGVINFNNGNVTVTHAAAKLTIAGGDVHVADAVGVVVGHTAQLTVGATIPELQVLGTTTGVDGSMVLGTASTTDGDQSMLKFLKIGNAALGSFTIMTTGESLGRIDWCADDGVDYATVAARIGVVLNGTIAASRMPADIVFSTDPGGSDDAIREAMRLSSAGALYIGDTSNAKVTIGLTINQAANDDSILEFKSSDVAHGVTDVTETDTYGLFRKYVAANGGLEILGIEDTGDTGLALTGVAVTANATRSTSGAGAIMLKGSLKSGTGVATIGGDKNILTVSDNGTVRFILDTDGDSFQDVGTAWTNFDSHDDLILLNSLANSVARPENPIGKEFGGWLKANKAKLESLGLVHFNEDTDSRPFVNMSRLTMLLVGAVRQLGVQLAEALGAKSDNEKLERRLEALERRLS